ncbi:MAG: DUF3179 domain-containing protein [Chloroflexota bacterium]|nr:DUF3179 domain-containing protein [Chloroflexota bacterium]MDE2895590.1 DUF3179 domain-containing protein [Chloroflexota bacterium]
MTIIRNLARAVGATVCLVVVAALAVASCSDGTDQSVQDQPAAASEQQVQQEQQSADQSVARQSSPQEQSAQANQSADEPSPQSEQQQPRQHEQSAQDEPTEPTERTDSDQSAVASAQDQESEQEEQVVSLPVGTVTFLPLEATETAEGIPIIRDGEVPQYFGLDWGTIWGIRLIELDELSQGAGRDAIPAINGPRYWTLEEASQVYTDNVPLVYVNVNGDVRGFPLEILTWHEIVNDTVGGVPVAITYCPLCNTAIAFEAQIGEEVYVFGVSGLLRNSDLVMYDRNTESLWQQSSGRAIVGTMVGARLRYVPAPVVTVGQLRSAFPDALVMSRDTGWYRAYGQNPYQGYDNPEYGGPYGFFFDRDSIDERLPPAERVVSIEGPSGAAIAYAWSTLEQEMVVHDRFDGLDLVVFWTPGALSILDSGIMRDSREIGTTAVFESKLDGQMLTFIVNSADDSRQTFVDQETGTVWDIFGRGIEGELAGSQLTRVIHSDHFWFAWQAFHPDTEVVSLIPRADGADDS